MFLLAAILIILFLLYVRWTTRYRYPPADVPQALCYHKLSTRFCLEGTWMTPRRFLSQIDYLVERGYRFIGEEDFFGAMDTRSDGNNRNLLLTFDDGYDAICPMFLEHLAPRGIPVLVFLVTGYVGRENTWDLSLGRRSATHLSWSQIVEMSRHGASFGSHGVTHVDLTRAGPKKLEDEIVESRRVIQERTGKDVHSFSYPFGRYNPVVSRVVEKAGYQGAFSLYPQHSNERVDRYALRRNGVYVIDTNLTLEWKIKRGPFFWFEEMKCRTINSVAVLTPLLKKASRGQDK